MARKRFFVEQFDDVPNDSGYEDKDVDSVTTAKAQKVADEITPKGKPLDAVKALTEQVEDDAIDELISLIKDLTAKVDGLIAEKKETFAEEKPEEVVVEEPLTEEAIGYEGDTPSGVSLGKKTDIDGGIMKKDVNQTSTAKAEEPIEKAIPKEEPKNVLNENLSGRKIFKGSNNTEKIDNFSDVIKTMREYARGFKE